MMAFLRTRKTNKGLSYHVETKLENGKTSTRTLGVISGTEANRQLKIIQAKLLQEEKLALFSPKITFEKFVSDYYLAYSKNSDIKSEDTYARDMSDIKILLKVFGSTQIKDIDNHKIEKFNFDAEKANLSPRTRRKRLMILSSILRYAREKNFIGEMPKLPQVKVADAYRKRFSELELQLILKNVRPFVHDIVFVCLHTAIRVKELRFLKWSHIDFVQRNLHIDKSKTGKERHIPINEDLFNHLQSLKVKSQPNAVYVFENEKTRLPYAYDSYGRAFKRSMKPLGLAGSIGCLRPTSATLLTAIHDANVYKVQKIMGHASVNTTQIYAQINLKDLRGTMSLLESKTETKTENGQSVEFKIA